MSLLGPVCAFLASGTWAIGTSVYVRLGPSISGAAVNATRVLVAAPLFLLALVWMMGADAAARALTQVPAAQVGYLTLSALASYAVGDVLFLASARRLGAPTALAIGSIYPIWAAIMGIIFFGEAATPSRIAGVLAVVAGTVTVILTGARQSAKIDNDRPRRAFIHGTVLALVTSGMWAFNNVGVRLGGASLPAVLTGTIRLGLGLVLCPLVGWIVHLRGDVAVPFRPFVPWQRLRPIVWVFALEAGLGSFFYVYGVSNSPMALGAPLTSLAPVLSLPVAWITRTEPLSGIKAIAVATVTTGVILLLS